MAGTKLILHGVNLLIVLKSFIFSELVVGHFLWTLVTIYWSCCIPSLIAYLVCTPLTSDIVLAAALAVGHVERVTLQERFTAFSNVERPLAVEVREVQWRGGGLRGAGDRERSEKIPKVGGCHSHAVSSSPTIMWPSGFESQAHHLSFFNLYY